MSAERMFAAWCRRRRRLREHAPFSTACDAIFLSIVIDAAELPGSSAAAPGTLSSREMIAIVRTIAPSLKFIGCDLSELSPPWDVSGMTAKLAARLFLEVWSAAARPPLS